jgi:hypothetical protein
VWRGGQQTSGNSRGQQPAIRLPRERGLVFHGPSPTHRRDLVAEYSASPMAAPPGEFRR